jgi:nucleotide-binding universal stress UspA family protein
MKILLAVDGSASAEAATQAVAAQFSPGGADVRVLNADEWPAHIPQSLSFAEGPNAASDLLDVRDERRRQGEEIVARAARRLQAAGVRTSTVVCEGDPRDAILGAAASWKPDLIVVGSHGRKGIDRFLLGSVSESIVRHAPCSVQVVRVPSTVGAA